MDVDIIETHEGFVRVRENWERVHRQDAEADYFLSWRWLDVVLRANPGRWLILAVRGDAPDAEYVCFLPLSLETRWSRSRSALETDLDTAGRLSWAQYTGFVCLPEVEGPAVARAAEALRRLPWGYFSFRNCSASQGRLDAFLTGFDPADYEITWEQALMNGGEVDNLVCPYIDLPASYEAWLESLSSNTRQKIRRFSRKLEGSPDSRIAVAAPEEFPDYLRRLLELWTAKWEPVRGADDARSTATKYEEILSQSFACDAMFVPGFWQGDALAGALAVIVDRDKRRMYFIAAGRDEQASDPSVGLLLHACSIRWAIEQGIRVYDFCHGNETYKYSLGAVDRRIHRLLIRRRSHVAPGRFDSRCLGLALDHVVRYIREDRRDDAMAACRFLRTLCR
jgi:hypothetical protein